jgi:hypothetical protein
MRIWIPVCVAMAVAAGCVTELTGLRGTVWYAEQRRLVEADAAGPLRIGRAIWTGKVERFKSVEHGTHVYDTLVLYAVKQFTSSVRQQRSGRLTVKNFRGSDDFPNGVPENGQLWAVSTFVNRNGDVMLESAMRVITTAPTNGPAVR